MAVTTRRDWLRAYDALGPARADVRHEFRKAEETGDYYRADEAAANLNEALADLADQAADMFRAEREHAEDIL